MPFHSLPGGKKELATLTRHLPKSHPVYIINIEMFGLVIIEQFERVNLIGKSRKILWNHSK